MNTDTDNKTASAQPDLVSVCAAIAAKVNHGETLSQFADRIISDDTLSATAENGDKWTGETQDGHFIYSDQFGNLYESNEKPAYRLPIVINRYSDQQKP